MTQVFLNYRTDDEPFGVTMLDRALSQRFGSSAVFLAAKSIPPGDEWERRIFEAIDASVAMLVIIGRKWLDPENRRRLDDPTDFVRREIRHALDHDGKHVVPVRLGVKRLSKRDLPETLADLAGRQDVEVRFRKAAIDVDHLARKLAERIPALRAAARTDPVSGRPMNIVRDSEVNTLLQATEVNIQGDFNAGLRDH